MSKAEITFLDYCPSFPLAPQNVTQFREAGYTRKNKLNFGASVISVLRELEDFEVGG